ncbi:MAG: hypothetical protein KDD83_20500 [Caldilineaceae bacterium]|nr:hypothetical protein [Caldilineaceae bacterium]
MYGAIAVALVLLLLSVVIPAQLVNTRWRRRADAAWDAAGAAVVAALSRRVEPDEVEEDW